MLQLTLLEMLSNSLHERILHHGNWWMILTVTQLFLSSTACIPLRVSKTWIREHVFSLTSTMGTLADLSCEYQPSLSSDLLALLKALTPKWHCQATPPVRMQQQQGKGSWMCQMRCLQSLNLQQSHLQTLRRLSQMPLHACTHVVTCDLMWRIWGHFLLPYVATQWSKHPPPILEL